MLSLVSSRRPSPTGTRVLVNCVIVCGSPSSYSSKASRGRPVASFPSASTTVAATMTMSTPERRT
jgi:hypothetical protein